MVNVVCDVNNQALMTCWTAKLFINSTETSIHLASCTFGFTEVQCVGCQRPFYEPLLRFFNQKGITFFVTN